MLSLLVLLGAVTSLSMIVPDVDTEDGDIGQTDQDTQPPVSEDQGDDTPPNFISGSDDGVDVEDTTDDADDEKGEDGNDDDPEAGPVKEADEPDTPAEDEKPVSPSDEADPKQDPDPQKEDDTEGGDDGGEDGGDDDDETAPDDTPVKTNASISDYKAATHITLTYADGETVDIDLEDHRTTDTDLSDRGGYMKHEIPLEDGSTLEFTLDWAPDDLGHMQNAEHVDVVFGDDQTDWDVREDGFTVTLMDAEGNPLHDIPIDIDTLELNDQANTVVTSNTIKVSSPGDQAHDDIHIFMDDLDEGETHPERAYFNDGMDPPPPGAILPANNFTPNDGGDAESDQVEVEIDPNIEGHVHLLNVTITKTPLGNLNSFSLNGVTGHTVQYVIQSDSADAPTVADLNLHPTGAILPSHGIEVLGAFNLGSVEVSVNGGSTSSLVEPEYTGKAFTTETSASRSFITELDTIPGLEDVPGFNNLFG